MRELLMTLLVVVLALPQPGCAPPEAELFEVQGVVLLDGEPLEMIRVEFWPESNGPQSAANTDATGRFEMMTWDGVKKGSRGWSPQGCPA